MLGCTIDSRSRHPKRVGVILRGLGLSHPTSPERGSSPATTTPGMCDDAVHAAAAGAKVLPADAPAAARGAREGARTETPSRPIGTRDDATNPKKAPAAPTDAPRGPRRRWGWLALAAGACFASRRRFGAARRDTRLVLSAKNVYDKLGPLGAAYPWTRANAVGGERTTSYEPTAAAAAKAAAIAAAVAADDDGVFIPIDVSRAFEFQLERAEDDCETAWVLDGKPLYPSARITTLRWRFEGVGARTVGFAEACYEKTLFGSSLKTRSVGAKVAATHVRREVRDLEERDRTTLLDAMALMYRTPTAEGRRRFGPDFAGVDLFQRWHHVNAAQRDADHLHQGSGFLAQHAKITLLFERSLQTISPDLSVPYWDPTLDRATVEQQGGTTWDLVLWSDEWFGVVKPVVVDPLEAAATTNDTYAIQSGRFAFLKQRFSTGAAADVPRNSYFGRAEILPVCPGFAMSLKKTTQAVQRCKNEQQRRSYGRDRFARRYGLLRAPWNNNAYPWVTRYPKVSSSMPSCQTHRAFAMGATENETFANLEELRGVVYPQDPWRLSRWMVEVSNEPHGPMHSTPGGMLYLTEQPRLEKLLGPDYASAIKQHTLWRMGVVDFPSNCTGRSSATCIAACNATRYSRKDAGYEVYKANVYVPSPEQLEKVKANATFLEAIGNAYCDEMQVSISGDAKDSGGCIEPSFWPIHPTFERLFQYRLLKGPGFVDDDDLLKDALRASAARASRRSPFSSAVDELLRGRDDDVVEGAYWPVDGVCFGARSVGVDPDRLCIRWGHGERPAPPTAQGAAECCAGHFKGSRLFTDVTSDQTTGPSNALMAATLDPRVGPDFAYPIYHHFKWAHCVDAPFGDV